MLKQKIFLRFHHVIIILSCDIILSCGLGILTWSLKFFTGPTKERCYKQVLQGVRWPLGNCLCLWFFYAEPTPHGRVLPTYQSIAASKGLTVLSVLDTASHSEGLSKVQRFYPKLWLSLFDLASLSFTLLCLDNCADLFTAFPIVWECGFETVSQAISNMDTNDFFLWYLDILLGLHTIPFSLGSSVPWNLGWSSSLQAAHPGCLPWPFFPAAIMVKCLTWPFSGFSMSQNQHTIRTSGFFRADPKRSIYPDIDILMSNGQNSEDTLLVAK